MRDPAWFTEFNHDVVSYDPYSGFRMVRCRCACCNTCWAFVDRNGNPLKTPHGVLCFYGGPYQGFVEC